MDFKQKLETIAALAKKSQKDAPQNTVSRNINLNCRSLEVYSDTFCIDIPKYVLWKRKQLDRPVVVADFCCGYGAALGELEERVGDAVHVIGFDINYYPDHDIKRGDFVVVDLKKIQKSVLPEMPASHIDIAFSLYGVSFHFDTSIDDEHHDESTQLNIRFYQEVERLLVPGGEGYFHAIQYDSNTFERVQVEVQSFLQQRTIVKPQGIELRHVWMKKRS